MLATAELSETNYQILESNSRTLDLGGFRVPVRILTYGLDMSSNLSFEEILLESKYKEVNKDINLKNFPLDLSRPAVSRIHHLWFDKKLPGAWIPKALDHLKFKAAVISEIAMFGFTYPDLQYRGPIVALGSTWYNPCLKEIKVPCLTVTGADRVFLPVWGDSSFGWGTHYSFLAVDK